MASLLGAGYDSSDDDATVPNPSVTTATKIVAAPEVNTEVWSPMCYPIRLPCFGFYHLLHLRTTR